MPSSVEGLKLFPSFMMDHARSANISDIMLRTGECEAEPGLRMVDLLIQHHAADESNNRP